MNERRLELEGEIERMKQRLSYNIKLYHQTSAGFPQQHFGKICAVA